MKKNLLLSIALLMTGLNSFAQWEWQNPLPQGNDLNSVFFTDANTGYALGFGISLKTINGGESWTAIPLSLQGGIGSGGSSGYFTDANTGYQVRDESVFGLHGIISKTVDGGANWTELFFGGKPLLSVYFPDANTGYAVGGDYLIGGIILKTANEGTTWTTQSGNVTTSWLTSIYFADAETGFVTGAFGTLLKTVNAGLTWDSISSGTDQQLTGVFFSDANKGYAVGNNVILKTTNSGSRWSLTPTIYYVNSIGFANTNTVYALGNTFGRDNYGVMLKTTDEGITWTADTISLAGYFSSFYFTDTNTGYAVGSNSTGDNSFGFIKKTIDGGITWTEEQIPNTTDLSSIYFTDANTGFAVGFYFHNPDFASGIILKTMDGGFSWDTLSSGTTYALHSVFFIDHNTGYATGENGTILKTTDAGSTWTSQTTGTANGLYSAYFTDTKTGYVVGDRGTILKTTNGGYGLGVNDNQQTISLKNSLKIYPNPTTETITIEPSKTGISINGAISIFGMTGRVLIQQKVLGYKVEINVRSLPTGIYFI